MLRKVVLAAQPLLPSATKLFEENTEYRIASSPDPSVIAREIKGVHALAVRLSKVTAEMIEAADALEVIGRNGAGVDNIDLDAATRRGIPVVFTPEANSVSVAEHVLGVALSMAKGYNRLDQATRAGNWGERDKLGRELTGLTFGFIGLGRIGALAARKCKGAFDAQIVAFDPYARADVVAELGATLVGSIDDLLRQSDVVSLHVPLTPETKGLIGARELALMKPTAYLINASRGTVVDEDALAEGLRGGAIAGAALDVFGQEPLPAGHPLSKAPNLLLTPHAASLTVEAMNRMATTMATEMITVLAGDKPRYVANAAALAKR
jgi:D-3-phosphoglycerate dehydrogenase / 2-oxoglutarate reductase